MGISLLAIGSAEYFEITVFQKTNFKTIPFYEKWILCY
jgi:hypothetical protein